MAWSKSTRIKVMLALDTVFFLLELGVGFAVHSLALMADAFHMLNDIISLLVGLWAVSVASKATTDKFSYGWLRAEILGAFFNAVFLIALCVSIVLEALTRFIDPPEIGNAQLILIVGCLGLASNLVGFVVLGGHGHSHGPGEHGHGEEEHSHEHAHAHAHGADRAAEEGRAGPLADEEFADDEGGPDLFPEAAVARYRASGSTPGRRERRTQGGNRHGRFASIGDMSIHPASFRQEIIAASRPQPDDGSSSDSNTEDDTAVVDEGEAREDTPLLKGSPGASQPSHSSKAPSKRARRGSGIHHAHNHNKPKKSGKKHGHSHDDMGMNAMVLHVLGDALGNVGVIATALIIWLTEWPGRYYADPAVSLFITLIILRSCIPLTIAASKILLQATPEHIDLADVREDIQALPGVISCHHVHIWQLSDTKVVASMHIQVAFPISEAGGEKYMELSMMARKCLHAYGIHSATIQPEFCLDRAHAHAQGFDAAMRMDGASAAAAAAVTSAHGSRCGSVQGQGDVCLLDCVDDCVGQGCCSPSASRPESSHSAEGHGHDHDHDHDHEHEH
ncbi:cation efflux protein [Parachaetomium inaequale]|uniref:Cation efflux protein n=1 Tax=Parachaetomium inaequale TaxID=2588326 RepID=A0AAN6SUL7_9PEZI|nr:cation efflux protein [Parachaetomium inaequale]